MIPAAEALALPSAQLTDEEKAAADKLEALIEEHVRMGMRRNGVNLQTPMTHPGIITEVNQRLRTAGWVGEWQPLLETNSLNRAMQKHVGFKLSLYPTDESYRTAARATLS
jgi:hypothetical protein